jgi:hypothetical protein
MSNKWANPLKVAMVAHHARSLTSSKRRQYFRFWFAFDSKTSDTPMATMGTPSHIWDVLRDVCFGGISFDEYLKSPEASLHHHVAVCRGGISVVVNIIACHAIQRATSDRLKLTSSTEVGLSNLTSGRGYAPSGLRVSDGYRFGCLPALVSPAAMLSRGR